MKENRNLWDFELSEQDMHKNLGMDIGHSEIIDHSNAYIAKWLSALKIHE